MIYNISYWSYNPTCNCQSAKIAQMSSVQNCVVGWWSGGDSTRKYGNGDNPIGESPSTNQYNGMDSRSLRWRFRSERSEGLNSWFGDRPWRYAGRDQGLRQARICAESVDHLDAEAAEIIDIVSTFENKKIRLGGEEEKTNHVKWTSSTLDAYQHNPPDGWWFACLTICRTYVQQRILNAWEGHHPIWDHYVLGKNAASPKCATVKLVRLLSQSLGMGCWQSKVIGLIGTNFFIRNQR